MISLLDASITPCFRGLESGAGLVPCGHPHETHRTNAHQGCPSAPLTGGRGATRRVTAITDGLYDLQCIFMRLVGLGPYTECGSAPKYMKLPSYLLL